MGYIVGSVDDRLRPLVRVEQVHSDRDFLALLDTGFNGQIFVSAQDADRLGITHRGTYTTAEFAGGQRQRVQTGVLTINWLGKPRRVEALIAMNYGNAAPRPADEPVALIGTELLNPHLLLIDFAARTIEIEGEV